MAALRLAQAGFRVVCLEQGDWPDVASYPGAGPEWELAIGKQWSSSPNLRQGPADYPVDDSRSDLTISNFNGVGGGMVLYATIWPRMLPYDFRTRSVAGVGDDWPLTYEELQPFYERVDRQFGVSGLGGNPAYPPRRGPATPADADRPGRHAPRPGSRQARVALVARIQCHPVEAIRRAARLCASAGVWIRLQRRGEGVNGHHPLAGRPGVGRPTHHRRTRPSHCAGQQGAGLGSGMGRHGRSGALPTGHRRPVRSQRDRHAKAALGVSFGIVRRRPGQQVGTRGASPDAAPGRRGDRLLRRAAESWQGHTGSAISSLEFYGGRSDQDFAGGCKWSLNGTGGPMSQALALGLGPMFGADHQRAMLERFGRTARWVLICEDQAEEANRVELSATLTDSSGLPAPRWPTGSARISRQILAWNVERATESLQTAGAYDVKVSPFNLQAHLIGHGAWETIRIPQWSIDGR